MNVKDYHHAVVQQAYSRVVNIHTKQPYDQYIGRAKRGDPKNKWANPITMAQCNNNRELCAIRYLAHVQRTKLYEHTHELKGMRLGCFCAPKMCHGHILARLSIEPSIKEARATLQRLITQAVTAHAQGKQLTVAVSGSRDLTHDVGDGSSVERCERFEQDAVEVFATLDAMPWRATELHHGDCKGFDQLATLWSAEHKIQTSAHPVEDWSKGTWQGPARNKAMLDEAQAFASCWDGKTKNSGTLSFVQYAWQSPDWICWQVPVQSHRIVRRFYGVRWDALFTC